MKVRMLAVAAFATVLVAAIPGSAQTYKWVAVKPGDCDPKYDLAAPTCNLATPAKPNPEVCNSANVNMLSVCWDQTPPYPLASDCNIPACTYKNKAHLTLKNCTGTAPTAGGTVFECQMK